MLQSYLTILKKTIPIALSLLSSSLLLCRSNCCINYYYCTYSLNHHQ
uniref:Uncharacterized protein n=1 Tax=Amphimedon queenslandica TaxID=400682 RepID=A0A1X7U252_AMPQE